MRASHGVFIALLILFALIALYAFYYGPYPAYVPLGDPSAYKNTYIHVPVAVASYVLFTIGMAYSALYLYRKRVAYWEKSRAYIAVGLVLATLTLVQGSLWAKESWGTYWNWDPRETGVLLLWLAYLVWLAVSKSIPDREKAMRISSAYAVAAYATVPFSFLLPYVTSSLHPRVQETSQMMGGEAAALLPLSIVAGVALGIALAEFFLKSRDGSRESRLVGYAGILVLLVLAASIMPAALPYLKGGLTGCQLEPGGSAEIMGVVVEADVWGESVKMEVQGGSCTASVTAPPSSIHLAPLVVTLPGGEGEHVTIKGHTVLIKGVAEENTVIRATEVIVLENWSVIANVFLLAITLIALVAYSTVAGRMRK